MMQNREIAHTLYELADLLEMRREPAFRVRAFRVAARAVEALSEPCQALLERGTLTDVPGIGAGTVRRIQELLERGQLAELEALRAQAPRGLGEIMQVEGMGARSAELVWQTLGIGTLDQLEQAAREGRLRALPRFGEKREQRVLRGIERYRRASGRFRLKDALALGEELAGRVRALPGALRIELCGTIRRRCATVGDIDLLVAA